MKQTALVTGASSGIGLELSRILAREGFDLVLVARREGSLRALASELKKAHGSTAHVFPCDLARPEAPVDLALRVAHAKLDIDILVNNAGFGQQGPFDRTDLGRVLDMIQVNVTTLTELTKRFLPAMLEHRRGRVLNVASTAAFQPGPLMAVYYATKAYVLSLSEALANELSGSGVTVTALCPGATRSEFQQTAGMHETRLFKSPLVADARAVAEAGYKAMMRGERVHVPGLLNQLGVIGTRVVPRRTATAIARALLEPRPRSS